MPADRNITITTPKGGMITAVEPNTADKQNTVFHVVNMQSRKRRGFATFGSREGYVSASDSTSTASTEAQIWAIGSSVISIGTSAICAIYTEPISDPSTLVSTTEPDIYYREQKVKIQDTIVFFSRIGFPSDFDIGVTKEDASRAVAIPFPEDVVAVVPYNGRACWVLTKRTCWLITGNPVKGRLQCKSHDVGTFSQQSADVTDVGEIYFLSRCGLCSCGIEGRVVPFSEESIPNSFGETDGLVGFDDLRQKVYALTASFSCQVDLRDKSIWEIEISELPVIRTKSDDGSLLFVSSSGEPMRFSKDATCETAWSVVFGPYQTSQNLRDGMVRELQAYVGLGMADIEVITSKSANVCLDDAIDFIGTAGSYTAAEGFNHVVRPRKRGAFFCVVLQGTGDFGLDKIMVMSTMKGRQR
jgi:hypothetical protein